MFSAGVRQAGIKLMAKRHTQEGLETPIFSSVNGHRREKSFPIEALKLLFFGDSSSFQAEL